MTEICFKGLLNIAFISHSVSLSGFAVTEVLMTCSRCKDEMKLLF